MENNNQNVNQNNSDRLKWAACFVPFLWFLIAIVLHFTEQNKSKELIKNIQYSIFFFVMYFILRMVFWSFFLWFAFTYWFLGLIYFIVCIIFWIKAFKWEDYKIEAVDWVIWNVNKTVNRNTNNVNTQQPNTNSKIANAIDNVVNKKNTNDEFEEVNENEVKTNNIVVDKLANGFASMVSNVKKEKKDEFLEDDKSSSENKKNEDVLNF